MKIKNIKYLLFTIAMIAGLALTAFTVSAAETTTTTAPPVQPDPADIITIHPEKNIEGSVNNAMVGQEITLNANGDGFAKTVVNADVTSWFDKNNFPKGLKAKIKSSGSDGAETLTIVITGTPTEPTNPTDPDANVIAGILVPQKYIKNGKTDVTVDTNTDVKWNILDTLEVVFESENINASDEKYGSVTATVNGKSVTSPAYVVIGNTIKFTAVTANKNSQFEGWKLGGKLVMEKDKSGTSTDKPFTNSVFEVKVEANKVEANEVGIRVNAVFGPTPSAYKVFYDVEEDVNSDEDDDITTFSMQFGDEAIKIPIAKLVITSDLEDEEADNGYKLFNSDELVTYEYEFKKTPTSSNAVIAKIEYVEDPDGNYFKITAQGTQGADSATAKVTITVASTTNATQKLADGKIEFTIEVTPAKTDIEQATIETTGIITANTTLVDGKPSETLTIDFAEETAKLSTGKIGGYTANGTTWTAISISGSKGTDISAIFNKNCSDLKFTKELKNGKPAAGSEVWTIGVISARPKSPKPKIIYGLFDDDGELIDGSQWTIENYESYKEDEEATLMVVESKDGKIPTAGKSYKEFEPQDVAPLSKDGKVVKLYYLVKLVPHTNVEKNDDDETYTFTPSSKAVKITVSSQIKPGKIKVDYKKEKVTLKHGMVYKKNDEEASEVLSKPVAKVGILFEEILSASDSSVEITYWTEATGKTPQSAVTKIKVNNYTAWSGRESKAVEGGYDKLKHTYKLPKGYEVFDESKRKWVSSVKGIYDGAEFIVRKKGNAKFDLTTKTFLKPGTLPASKTATLTVSYGEYNTGKKDKSGEPIMKNGITKVTVEQVAAN